MWEDGARGGGGWGEVCLVSAQLTIVILGVWCEWG